MDYDWEDYEYDPAKRSANLIKHRIDFDIIETFHWRTAYVRPSPRGGESRYYALGYIGERLYAAIYTVRGNICRVISLRKANPREEEEYAQSRAQA